jgi:hypothetical protein
MSTTSYLNNNGQCNSSANSPISATGDFNQQHNHQENHHLNRLNTGLLTIASNLNEQQQSIGLNNLMLGNNNDKTTLISNLENSNFLQSNYSSSSSHTNNNLKLHIKTEPDEQQRDFTSACTSDNSIYSPCALSNSTELTGYHSPTSHNNLLFGHVLNG